MVKILWLCFLWTQFTDHRSSRKFRKIPQKRRNSATNDKFRRSDRPAKNCVLYISPPTVLRRRKGNCRHKTVYPGTSKLQTSKPL